MSRIIFLFALLLVLSFQSIRSQWLQEKGYGILNLERHQFTINLLGPGFRYELGLLRNVSVSTSFTPGLATYDAGYTFGFAWHTRIRYYHNFKNRLDINKNIVGNSADYLAPARSVFWGPLQISQNLSEDKNWAVAFYGGVYGIQRTYRKGFNFNAEAGFGYYRGDGVPNGFGPLINFTFGWVATKRKSRSPFSN